MEANGMQNDANYEDFNIYLLISHYYAIRSACLEIDSMVSIVNFIAYLVYFYNE